MITSFKCKKTENLFNHKVVPIWSKELQNIALRKLYMLDAAYYLNDLRVPPANRLKKIFRKDANNLYSIRINKQYRILFEWHKNNASEVEIIDYH